MKGQVLDYSIQKNEGIITGTDDRRYTFSGTEWKETTPPTRNMNVDFEARDETALGVYRTLGLVPQVQRGTKTKAALTLWNVFLGGLGAHKFYLGSWGWGIVYLLTCWLYIPFLVSLIEVVRVILMTDEEFYVRLAEFEGKNPGPFGFFW